IAVLLGPGAKPVEGRVNVILGGCLKEYRDQGVFVDFCPVYNQDVEQAISVALGEKKEFEFMWDGLLKTYSEKEDKSLPGF
ncbi:MAG: hypothetical protein QXL67_00285, partial [Candidatus Bathyarchaeia archaeon]